MIECSRADRNPVVHYHVVLLDLDLGCYQSYGWDEHFGNDLVFYLNNARLSPDPSDPMVDQCTRACADRGYDHAALEDGTACMCGHGPPTMPALVGECLPCSDDATREW